MGERDHYAGGGSAGDWYFEVGFWVCSKLAGNFKELMVRWLRNNHSESSLIKKDATNKGQVMYKMAE
jgi:hypothetical protein